MALVGRLRPLGGYAFRMNNYSVNKHLITDPIQQIEITRFSFVGRCMSSASSIVNIDINELQKFQKNPNATIIDVREPDEIKETGNLPGSTNIPLANIAAALQEDPAKFKEKYHIQKPLADNPLVFSCRSGRRSLQAGESASSLGYKKVYNYAGGILDWLEHFPKENK